MIKTVGELISELSKYAPDMEIGVDNDEYVPIKCVRLEHSEEEYSNHEWLEIELEGNYEVI